MKFNLGHGYDYDDTTGTINLDDEIVLRLKGTKCKILTELLKKESGEPTSREELIMAVWGKDDLLIYGSALTQQIHLLRKEMETIGFKNYIQSQSRKGYFISTPYLPVKNESINVKTSNTQRLPVTMLIIQLLIITLILTFHLKI